MNPGNGGGQVRGQGLGRMGSLLAGNGTGFCICTKCGHRESHARALRCVQKQCPKCGTGLTRE